MSDTVKEKCSDRVFDGWHYHPCQRNAWRDGFCKQHHPDSVAARKALREKQYEENRKRQPWYQLQELTNALNDDALALKVVSQFFDGGVSGYERLIKMYRAAVFAKAGKGEK